MKARFRYLSALLALLALTVAAVQDLWASTCRVEMETAVAAAAEPAAPSDACPHGIRMATLGTDSPREGPQSSLPDCPGMPMSVSGACGTAAALPEETGFASSYPPAGGLLPHRPDEARDLLIVAAFFRPPIS